MFTRYRRAFGRSAKVRVGVPAVAVMAVAACSLGVSSAANAGVNWSNVKSATAGGGLQALVAAAKEERQAQRDHAAAQLGQLRQQI